MVRRSDINGQASAQKPHRQMRRVRVKKKRRIQKKVENRKLEDEHGFEEGGEEHEHEETEHVDEEAHEDTEFGFDEHTDHEEQLEDGGDDYEYVYEYQYVPIDGTVDEEPEHNDEEDIAHEEEYERVKDAVAHISYRMSEINVKARDCLETEFGDNPTAPLDDILSECVGVSYRIIFHNYDESMRRVKHIFLDILKGKFKDLPEEFDDEINFFLDVVEDFINKDFKLSESIEISKQATKYYVQPKFYDQLIEMAQVELDALNAIHHRLYKEKKEIQELIKEKVAERGDFQENLVHEASHIEELADLIHHEDGELEEEHHDVEEYEPAEGTDYGDYAPYDEEEGDFEEEAFSDELGDEEEPEEGEEEEGGDEEGGEEEGGEEEGGEEEGGEEEEERLKKKKKQ